MIRISRREILGTALFVTAVGPFGIVAADALVTPDATLAHVRRTLGALFPKGLDIGAIGQEYLYSPALDAPGLSKTLREVRGIGQLSVDQPAAIHERIVAAIHRDFEQDRLARVDTWVLSRTEAELCALCALGTARA